MSGSCATARRILKAKYKADARDKRQSKPSFCLSAKTLRELERLYLHRWGRHLPDDDAGRDDLHLALAYVAGLEGKIEWAADRAPWLPREDAEALAAEISVAPRWLKARALSERLGLTERERIALGIETIRPIDVNDETLAERTRQKDRERKARNRKLAGAPKPIPLSQSKPWEAEGISKATWYRRRKASETKSVRDNSLSLTADGICLTMPPADAVGTTLPLKKSIKGVVDGEAGDGSSGRRYKTQVSDSDAVEQVDEAIRRRRLLRARRDQEHVRAHHLVIRLGGGLVQLGRPQDHLRHRTE
jgi:hypothetical protein